ncbi:MAG: hypothetical protein COT06_05800 [Syntrophobacteraceae bacterium CG07_land_8_20_14_0_80_61_8]|nr:MAG: hypothetical protein COT06_05800 [Syntrophobacteraceae bacterium CG07_land_8_20_14_0_80_61_8]
MSSSRRKDPTMRTTIQKAARILATAVLLSAVQVSVGHAHDTWITMQDYVLSKSKPAVLTVASSHHFPALENEFMTQDRIDKVILMSSDGKELSAAAQGDKDYQSEVPLDAQGTYMAVAIPQHGFSSKTTEGYQRGKSKKDLKNVIECRYSERYGKALFTVGTPGGDVFSRSLGHKMEIIPMKDPAMLKEGDDLPVKVLIEGQPARTYVYGTYAGFSSESNTFAYTTYADKEGIAKIKIIKAGTWLLLAKQEMPYSDPTVCDKLSYAASLTFQVR